MMEMEMQETNNPKTTSKVKSPQEDPNLIEVQRKIRFGANRQVMKCPYCQSSTTTKIATFSTLKTHVVAVLLCLMCLWPCVPWVYCSDRCLQHKHYCSYCDKYLGKSRFGCTGRSRES